MPVIFKSKATGDLLMVNAHAEQILGLLNKTAAQPGIFQVHEMPEVIAVLSSLPDLSPSDAANDQENTDNPDHQGLTATNPSEVPMSEGISLRKRAWPLLQMIEASRAANQVIVWGV
jgi:Domain of unknown function (DUF1840)